MDKLLLRPKEAAELIGIGRTKVFELMRTGQLESVRIGSSRRIPAFALLKYVERLRTTAVEDAKFSEDIPVERPTVLR
jgi:excisionase family DNA binding protein